MKIYDIDILSRNDKQGKLYDFTQPTFKNLSVNSIYESTVEPHEEMRIDIICDRLMGSNEYVDFLLNFNDIENGLNIKSGDIIRYVDISTVDFFRVKPDDTTLTKSLLNINKQTRKDSNRQQYLEDNFSLPPTLLDTPIESVQVKGNQVIIGSNNNSI